MNDKHEKKPSLISAKNRKHAGKNARRQKGSGNPATSIRSRKKGKHKSFFLALSATDVPFDRLEPLDPQVRQWSDLPPCSILPDTQSYSTSTPCFSSSATTVDISLGRGLWTRGRARPMPSSSGRFGSVNISFSGCGRGSQCSRANAVRPGEATTDIQGN